MEKRRMYNAIARKNFEKIVKENGLKMIFISRECGIENTTLSKWRNEVFDFKEDKLSRVESFIKKY